MSTLLIRPSPAILTDQPIPTWFGIGGRADRLATPSTDDELAACLALDPELLVLGDGANLLVDDAGVSALVVSFAGPRFSGWTIDERTGAVRVGAGANLPKLINETVRRGLAGLEGLAGIPATIGGALVMNAGGAFGQIADAVVRVHARRRDGSALSLERRDIAFEYRRSGLQDLIITEAELALAPIDPAALRTRLLEVMEYKKASQPLADKSAGCVFKNPILTADLPAVASKGTRVSAGLLIDRAGCKGLAVGGASVSHRHANFIVTSHGARAGDVVSLLRAVRDRVADAFGVRLEPEIVLWGREGRFVP